jgi:hypothetical protein
MDSEEHHYDKRHGPHLQSRKSDWRSGVSPRHGAELRRGRSLSDYYFEKMAGEARK